MDNIQSKFVLDTILMAFDTETFKDLKIYSINLAEKRIHISRNTFFETTKMLGKDSKDEPIELTFSDTKHTFNYCDWEFFAFSNSKEADNAEV